MAIISTLIRRVRNVIGDRAVTYGTYGDASGGGEVDTGLEICEFLICQGTASASTGTAFAAAKVNVGKFPVSGSAVPIINNSTDGGIWFAYGR